MAVLPALVALRAGCSDDAAEIKRIRDTACGCCRDESRSARRCSCRHVELHGLGQCFDDCTRGGTPSAYVSQSHDCSGDSGLAHLCFSICCGVLHGHPGIEWLRFLIVLGGMMSAFGMFNALVMSYSRLPLAMAREGILPKFFAKTS